MKKIISKRREGKTAELIKLSHLRRGYIVCRDHTAAISIMLQAEEMGMHGIPFPLTYHEFIKSSYLGTRIPEVYIDDIEDLVSTMSHVPVYAITMSFGGDDYSIQLKHHTSIRRWFQSILCNLKRR